MKMAARNFNLLFVGLSFLLLCGCNQKSGLKEEYDAINLAASKLPGSKVYIINPSASIFEWALTGDSGRVLTGSFSPEKGSLVLEEDRLVAGFWSANVWDKNKINIKQNVNILLETRAIMDSTPKLKAVDNRTMKFELVQSGRNVLRSDYRSGVGFGIDTSATHILQGNLTIADSTVAVSLPINLKLGKGQVEIKGSFVVNYPDFGVGHRFQNHNPRLIWAKAIPVKFRLIFKETN